MDDPTILHVFMGVCDLSRGAGGPCKLDVKLSVNVHCACVVDLPVCSSYVGMDCSGRWEDIGVKCLG